MDKNIHLGLHLSGAKVASQVDCPTLAYKLMSDSEFAQYAFGGQGGQGGTKFPLQATGSRERIVSRRLTKDLLALTGAFEKLLGLMEEKLRTKVSFFYVICPSCDAERIC